ncbi:unnamed protein product, partial [Timema podura]|nr:unnamed protein product [Timema podura]
DDDDDWKLFERENEVEEQTGDDGEQIGDVTLEVEKYFAEGGRWVMDNMELIMLSVQVGDGQHGTNNVECPAPLPSSCGGRVHRVLLSRLSRGAAKCYVTLITVRLFALESLFSLTPGSVFMH